MLKQMPKMKIINLIIFRLISKEYELIIINIINYISLIYHKLNLYININMNIFNKKK